MDVQFLAYCLQVPKASVDNANAKDLRLQEAYTTSMSMILCMLFIHVASRILGQFAKTSETAVICLSYFYCIYIE